MKKQIDIEVSALKLTPEHNRRDWRPAPGLGLAGMWTSAAVSSASGQHYFGLRGSDDFIPGMTHVVTPTCGFRKLEPTLDTEAPALFPDYEKIDWFEPLQYSEDSGDPVLSFESGRIEWDDEGVHWYDAQGRWEMHGTPVSDIGMIHVPPQEDLPHPVYYRHQLLKAKGLVDGVEVEGYMHQDMGYGPEGMIYSELPFLGQLQSMWVSWLDEYEDGTFGGGCFWQGREHTEGFGPGYVLKNGATSVHQDIKATPAFHANGKVKALEVQVDDDHYSMETTMAVSPIHTSGRTTGTSFGPTPVKSWSYIEYMGELMSPEIVAWSLQKYRLSRGR